MRRETRSSGQEVAWMAGQVETWTKWKKVRSDAIVEHMQSAEQAMVPMVAAVCSRHRTTVAGRVGRSMPERGWLEYRRAHEAAGVGSQIQDFHYLAAGVLGSRDLASLVAQGMRDLPFQSIRPRQKRAIEQSRRRKAPSF